LLHIHVKGNKGHSYVTKLYHSYITHVSILVPERVKNVRAFSFRPSTDPSVLTGLVIWDRVEDIHNYTVRVTHNSTELPNVRMYV